jgi:hypothetical protein
MDKQLEQILIDRIKKPVPPGYSIQPGSVPIVFFGDFEKAEACTIGINPGDEFSKPRCKKHTDGEHPASRRPFEDGEELSPGHCKKVIDYCVEYFNEKYPFNSDDRFFKNLETVCSGFGAYSYNEGSLVHLDLVQWATTCTWNEVPEEKRNQMIKDDSAFLRKLLSYRRFKHIFINGSSARKAVFEALQITKMTAENVSVNIQVNCTTARYGQNEETSIIAWNPFVGKQGSLSQIGEDKTLDAFRAGLEKKFRQE